MIKISLMVDSCVHQLKEDFGWEKHFGKDIGAADVRIKFGEKGFPKNVLISSCFLIVTKDKFRSMGGSEFQR